MSLLLISLNTLWSWVKKFQFESVLSVLLIIYCYFYITPSSYGHALNLLGIPNDGLIYGSPQPIRSDEWSVWTPYLQALVNNDFQRFNALSIYHEDFRNFNALPIYDWALFFKPQYWLFLITDPARAFSFYHGLLITLFIIGWKQLTDKLLITYPYYSSSISIWFSLLLFFSGFIQTCWTTFGPLMAIFPWVIISLLSFERHALSYYLSLTYLTTMWLISQTYPPLIVSCSYIALCLIAAFQPDFFNNRKRCILSILSCLIGILIAVYYFKDVFSIMMNTIYPGKRVSTGGEAAFYLWLGTIIPYVTHSSDLTPIIPGQNICETTAASSLLPLMSLCFSRIKKYTDLHHLELKILGGLFIFFTCWMLFPVPTFIGKIILLSKVPSGRLVFGLGIVINYISIIILVKFGFSFTKKRILIFITLLIMCKFLPTIFAYFNYFKAFSFTDNSAVIVQSNLLLISLPLFLFVYLLYRYQITHQVIPSMVFIAMVANAAFFATFNPAQSAQTIFSAKNSEIASALKTLAQKDSRGWFIYPGMQGAVLNGLGIKAISHTLIQPKLDFFRPYFPELNAEKFNQVFNRYAHVELHDISEPKVFQLDAIMLPVKPFIDKHNELKVTLNFTDCEFSATQAGYLEWVQSANKILYLNGWAKSGDHRYWSNLKSSSIRAYTPVLRPTVAAMNHDADLLLSGFSIELQLSDEDVKFIRENGFCLFSESSTYGVNKIFHFPAKKVDDYFNKLADGS